MNIDIDNTNLPKKEEITIIKQDIQRDLTEFLQGISINVPAENKDAFFGKLEELITYKGSAVDFDRFREDFNTLIAAYSIDKKHNAIVPVESSSTDNVLIHDEQGTPKDLVASDNREETIINTQNTIDSKEETIINTQNTIDSKEETIINAQNTAASKEETDISAQNITESKEETDINTQNIAASKEETDISTQSTAASKEEIGISTQNITESKEETGISSQNTTESKEEEDISTQNITESKEETIISTQNITESKEETGISSQNITASKEEEDINTINAADNSEERTINTINAADNSEEIAINTINAADNSEEKTISTQNTTDSKQEKTISTINAADNSEEKTISTQNTTDSKEEEKINYEDLADKIIKNAEKEGKAEVLDLYMYNLLPYSITSTIMQAGNIAKKIGEGKLGVPSALSAGLSAWDLFNKRKYFTAGEIAKFFGTNFYTMQIPGFKGITIKDMSFPGAIPFSINTVRAHKYYNANGFITTYENLIRRKQDEIDLKRTYIKHKFRYEVIKYKKDDGTETADLNELLKNKTSIWQIGSIYVWPVDSAIAEKSWIPFEFNPDIAEASRAARYNATQILGRMGDLQSYVGTSSIMLTLTTKYFPTVKTVDSISDYPHSNPHGWMSTFDMKMVQMIELAYRSLVMPHFTPEEEPTEKGYQYMKPPLLKIIIGDKNKVQAIPDMTVNQPFSNFLTYPKPVLKTQHLASELKSNGSYRHFRTFVANSVEIRKNINESPLLLSDDETPYLMDTHGFEVSLSLTEVTPNYMDAVPSFGDYYEETRKIAYAYGGK